MKLIKLLFVIVSFFETLVCFGWEYGRSQKHSVTGAEFREIKVDSRLNDAWEDPSGMVWVTGSFIERADCSSLAGHACSKDQNFFKYCSDLGMNVATVGDYQRLTGYMGMGRGGYRGEILKDMGYIAHTEEGSCFTGQNGKFESYSMAYIAHMMGVARCVIHRSNLGVVEAKLRAKDAEAARNAQVERERKEQEERERQSVEKKEQDRRAKLSLEEKLKEAVVYDSSRPDYRDSQVAKELASNMYLNINAYPYLDWVTSLLRSSEHWRRVADWFEVFQVILMRSDLFTFSGQRNNAQEALDSIVYSLLDETTYSDKVTLFKALSLLLNRDDVDVSSTFLRSSLSSSLCYLCSNWMDNGQTFKMEAKNRVALLLIQHTSFNPNVRFYENFTPLMSAAAYGNVAVVEALLRRPETDVLLKNAKGLTARQLAKENYYYYRDSRNGTWSPVFIESLRQVKDLIKADPRWKKDPAKSWF